MTTVTLEPGAYRRITKHLRSRDTEQVVFLFLSRASSPAGELLRVEDFYIVPGDELVHESRFHAEVSGDAQAKVIKMAWDGGLALGEIHSHPGCSEGTSFSPSDLSGFAEFVPHVRWRLKGKPYVALVFGDTDFDALVWLDDPRAPGRIDALKTGARVHVPTGLTFTALERRIQEQERYKRQIALFGASGQELIQRQRVGIVGLGGLGCHVAQQLAYQGVVNFVLVDEDIVERSNLNRLITATESDIGKSKVEVTADFIRRIQPQATVTVVRRSFFSEAAFSGLENCDAIFGCVDNDGVRLGLLEFCCVNRRTYIDLASDVEADGTFGGRIIFMGPVRGCLYCKGELDDKEIWRFFASDAQREEDDRIYGVDRAALGESGPSVVSLNGVIASHSVVEYTALVTGLRSPQPHLTYRGSMGVVTRTDTPGLGCYYCGDIRDGKVKPDLSRLLVSPNRAARRYGAA